MNSVDSADKIKEMSDNALLVSKEAPIPEYPPPYEDIPSSSNLSRKEPSLGYTNPVIEARPPINPPTVAPSNPIYSPIIMQPSAAQQAPTTQINIGGNYPGFQSVGRKKTHTFCRNCQSTIQTKTNTSYKCCTHFCGIFLLLTTVIGLPCCCLPYLCCAPLKVEHTCPNCKGLIGTYYG